MESPAAPILYENIRVVNKYENIYIILKSLVMGLSMAFISSFIVKYTGLNIMVNNYLGYEFMLL
jgi:hypothetical protein